jgi:hypothetical protein
MNGMQLTRDTAISSGPCATARTRVGPSSEERWEGRAPFIRCDVGLAERLTVP